MRTRDEWVDFFTDFENASEHALYNIGHLVLDDHNVDDESIDFALEYIHINRFEYLKDNPEVTNMDINRVVFFLAFLKTIPDREDAV